jgi:hypothetical protein
VVKTSSSPLRVTGFGVLVLALVYGVVGAYDPVQLWSTNLIARFTAGWQAVLLLALVAAGASLILYSPKLAIKPTKQDKAKKSTTAKPKEIDLTDRPFIRWPAIAALVFAGICFAFPLEWSLLGDSTLFIGYGYRFEQSGHLAMPPREFLSAILSQTLYGLLSSFSDTQVASDLPFRIIGVVAGFIWCFVSIKLADLIASSRALKLLTLVLLLTCGGSLFFFGYVETYPLPYAAALWVIYLTLKHLRGECSEALLLLAVVLSLLLHLQNLLLLPGVVYALARRRKPDLTISWKMVISVAGALLVVYAYFQINPIARFSSADNPFISIRPVEDVRYTLFSAQHLLDLFNEHLLLAPCALVLLFGIMGKGLDWKRPEIQFALICSFFYEAYLIGANVQFGMARDWDIFAIIGPLFIILAVLLWQQRALDHMAYRRLAICASVVTAVCVAQWFYANLESKTSLNRYNNLLSLYEPLITKRNTHYGYENMRKVLTYFHPSQELFVIDKMLDLQQWPVTTNRVVAISMQKKNELGSSEFLQLRKIRDKILHMSDSVLLVEEVGEDKLRVDVPHSANVLNHADIFNFLVAFDALVAKQIDSTEAYRITNEFIALHPALPQGYELMAQLRMSLDRTHPTAIIPYANRSIEMDSGRPRPYLYLARANGLMSNTEETRYCLRKTLELDPSWVDAIATFVEYLKRTPPELRHMEDFALIRASCQAVLMPVNGLQEESSARRHATAKNALQLLNELER